jgi:hypothetical protein
MTTTTSSRNTVNTAAKLNKVHLSRRNKGQSRQTLGKTELLRYTDTSVLLVGMQQNRQMFQKQAGCCSESWKNRQGAVAAYLCCC